jgi:hypothetical protein
MSERQRAHSRASHCMCVYSLSLSPPPSLSFLSLSLSLSLSLWAFGAAGGRESGDDACQEGSLLLWRTSRA